MLFLAPSSLSQGTTFKCPISQTTYSVDANGIVSVTNQTDIQALISQGFIPLPIGRNNLSASSDPSSVNDSTQDYAAGSLWVNSVAGRAFICQSANVGAAIWLMATAGTTAGSATYAALTLTGLFTQSYTGTITAFAGGGQASATALTTTVNNITTVATAGDSVKLPAATVGLYIFVINSAANPCQVFGNGADTINSVAAATGVPQNGNSVVVYICNVAGNWKSFGSTTSQVNQVTNTANNTVGFTASAAQITGAATKVFLHLTGTLGAGANLTLPTMASVIAAIPDLTVGQSYELRIINESSANFAWTIVNNAWTTFTVPNPAISQYRFADFIITVLSTSTLRIEAVGNTTNTAQP